MDNQITIFDFFESFKTDKKPLKIANKVRLIELFGGIGSQAMALERMGVPFEHHRLVEFDKYCIKSYNAIHGTNFEPLDITKIHADDLGIEHTSIYTYLLTYSFPCQDLSVAGKMLGMDEGTGTRSGLLWEVKRLLIELRENLPQILLMENVQQVHGKGNIENFKSWCKFLEDKGYTNIVMDMNAADFGVPQNRKRCFMLSFLGAFSYEVPKPYKLSRTMADCLEDEVDDKYYINSDRAKMLIENLIEKQVLPPPR